MRSLAVLRELPADYEVVANDRAVLAVRRENAEHLLRAGFGLESDGDLHTSGLSGRRPLLELAAGEKRLLVRRFTHGGLLRWLTGRRFRDPERPFRELVDARRLALAGVACAPVVAARARRDLFLGWRLEVISEFVANSIDLGRAWNSADHRVRRGLLSAAGEFVAGMHRFGFVHADLHPRNLLVDTDVFGGARPRLTVIDLDRSRWRSPIGTDERRDNLRRLQRYAARDFGLGPRDFTRFMRAYQPSRELRRADWRAIRTAHRREHWMHAAGWGLERLFGRTNDPR